MQEEGGVVITPLKVVLAVAAVATTTMEAAGRNHQDRRWRRCLNSVRNDGNDEEVMTANPFLATIKLRKTGADFGPSNPPPPQDSEEHDKMEVAVTETCT